MLKEIIFSQKSLLSVQLFHNIFVDVSQRLLYLSPENRLIFQKVLNYLQEEAISGP